MDQTSGFRLSPQQMCVWSFQRQEPSLYHAQCAVEIEGKLDAARLKEALQKVVDRHEILRTTFQTVPGLKFPLQVIQEHSVPAYRVVDLRHSDLGDPEPMVERVCNEEMQTPFELERGPIVHASLLVLSNERHVLLLSLPALCADIQTFTILLKQIARSYSSSLDESQVPDTAIQYADFAEWQHSLIEGDDERLGRAYWEKQELNALPHLMLPFVQTKSEIFGFEPLSFHTAIATDLLTDLVEFTVTHNISLGDSLFACLQILLWKLTNQMDFVIHYYLNGRNYEELLTTIGLISKWVPIRSRIKPNMGFFDLLLQVQQSVKEGQSWQEYYDPFQNTTNTEGSAPSCFLPIAFEYREEPPDQNVGDVRFFIRSQYSLAQPFALKLLCTSSHGVLNVEFHFNASCYEPSSIKNLAAQLSNILRSITRAPESSLATLEILSELERHELLVEWNKTNCIYPEDQCIHHLFEAQAERTPQATAVIFDHERLSYRDLNQRANRLAHFLQARTLVRGALIGLCVERSIDMLVGMLGILKAGGCYVALDPEYPQSRLAFLLHETQPSVLLTQQHLLERLPLYGGTVICLDRDRDLFSEQEEVNPISKTTPEDLAYLVFTSGSTGTPKGILVPHRGVVNYLTYLASTYGLDNRDVVLQLASLSFDASVRDTIGPLTVGATVVFIKPGQVRDPKAILTKVQGNNVTCILSIVPTLLRGLLEGESKKGPLTNSLRLILVSGEVLYPADIQRVQDVWGKQVLVVNQYGPTECTLTSTFFPVRQNSLDVRNTILIGRPIANAQVYILDANLCLVPVGVAGELHIGGVGVTRGYLHRPDLTAERFIPNPFSSELGARLYRTGDRVRYRPDGNLEFLGRLDHQVKVRGFRIELGEIEAVLRQHPAVREAVVLAREDAPGEKRLVAYVVLAIESRPDSQVLRSYLSQQLPDYMVPSHFIQLHSLPLTPNGKLDRSALPEPDQTRADISQTFVDPRTAIERVLAEIWAELLGIDKVGIYDNFFELGGHSLLAMRVNARLCDAFEIELPLQTIFETPNVAGLAVAVETFRWAAESREIKTELGTAKIDEGKL